MKLTNWKFIRKFTLFTALIILLSSNSFSSEFGIGISVNESDTSILLPIIITENFKTELSIDYSDRNSDEDSAWTTVMAGIGLFYFNEVYEKTQIYIGARFLYLKSKFEYEDYSTKSDGYEIAPTLGFEYFLTDHVSIGGEAEIYYQYLNDEEDGEDYDSTYNGTNSRVILRYYF